MVNNNNSDLIPIINELHNVKNEGLVVNTTNFKLSNLIPMKIEKYYFYSGSLTTPSCDELVKWILVDSPVLGISGEQLKELQLLLDVNNYPMLTNARPIQPFNDRLVKRSFNIYFKRLIKDYY